MPIIRIKRGTTKPTTSDLSYPGEMAINTSTNEVFIRGNYNVFKVGGGLTLLYEGSGTIPANITSDNITLNQSINLFDKILAFEVRNMTGNDTYETHIVLGRMGRNSTTLTSPTYDRLYSWSVFDGRYFKTHSFKAYVSNLVTNKMSIGNVKHLVGTFSGTSIEWTTNTTTAIYLNKIWLVE